MASIVSFKGQACVWGTTELGTPIGSGICTAGTLEHQGQTDAVEDENGARTGIIFYDETYSASLTVVCKAGATPPVIGNAITCKGITLYVTNVREDWQNKGKKQLSVSAEGGKNVG